MAIIPQQEPLPEGPALYMTAVPIGNLADITLRALHVLAGVDGILCEDTRKTGILLKHYGLSNALKSYRIHRREADTEHALSELRQGKRLAFCSEAGTPAISDPGSFLVGSVREKMPEVPIIPIPGPSAMAAALSIAGNQTNPALYLGFLSPKAGRRRRALEEYREFPGLIVVYESVHRIEATLNDIRDIFPHRNIMIAREMTKIYEESLILNPESTPEEIAGEVGSLTKKGEFTLVIGPPIRAGK